MKITFGRSLIFLCLVLVVGLTMQQCWQRKSDAQKWLYLFDDSARSYAGRVLGPNRGTGLLPPEPLAKMEIVVHAKQGYVEFFSTMFSHLGHPTLHLAFVPSGAPPGPSDRAGHQWYPIRDSWYQLRAAHR